MPPDECSLKKLSPEALAHYQSQGYFAPVPALSAEEAAQFRRKLEIFEAQQGHPLKDNMRLKTHLLFTWLNDLVRHPAILDAVEDILGPDILVWNTSFFIKEAHDPGYVSWHQDSTYWGLSAPDVVTAWVALSPSTPESGCLRVLPGSHKQQVAHTDTFNKNNLLTRGQEIAVEVDENETVMLPLKPGEMSLHHIMTIHSSEPNQSDDRRIGFAIRYIPTRIRQTSGFPDSATLVRGEDRYGHFELEPRPQSDLSSEAIAYHRKATDQKTKQLYRGATVQKT
jgi:non-haem Fe2+, alpha-ketoglutarate-dependent halogenase